MATEHKGVLESRSDFKEDPGDQYRYWTAEIAASEKSLRYFRNQGTKIVRNYLGGARHSREVAGPETRGSNFRLNLFHSNVITLQSLLYGNLPKVTVSRRHDDPNDDTGRVAALIIERLLNNDVQDNGKEYTSVLRAVLQDRLLPGMGCARVRYEVETDGDQLVSEDAPIDYYHWRDVAWGWARTFSEIPWIGFRSFLKKDEVAARFGDEAATNVPLRGESTVSNRKDEPQESDEDSPWKKAEIWEIWDKERRQVVWMCPGYDKILDTKQDTLGLSGFYPCPPFLLANQTSTLYIPTSDFSLAQDLYNEVDVLQTRIAIITEAVKVVGVYDRSAEGISRMFKEGTDNDLIPVDNWALFAEKGGIAGQIDWVPIKEISETLLKLRELRDEAIGLLQQVTGMSDIMRGELGGQYEGVGQSELKAKFASVRVQALQDEFAQFASDLLQLKAEVIGLHFDPQTIAQFANVDETFDFELVPSAIELIKNPKAARLRVEIRPESVAMVDYAQLKQERVEYLTAISSFLQSAAPLIEGQPSSKPYLLKLLQWGLSGFKGSNEIEGVVDKAIQEAEKEDPQQNQNGEAAKEQAKAQGQMQLEQLKHKNALELIQAKSQADAQLRQADMQADIQTQMAELKAEQQGIIAAMQADLATISAKMHADMKTEQHQSQINALQNQAEVEGEMQKEAVKTALEVDKARKVSEMKIKEAKAAAAAKPKPEKPSG